MDENPQMMRDYILPAVAGYEPSNDSGILIVIQIAVIISIPVLAVVLVLFVRKRREI
ncbi:MAG: hypothetical protein ACTSSD_12175 [Candidatus Thorarchaeota archaeon]